MRTSIALDWHGLVALFARSISVVSLVTLSSAQIATGELMRPGVDPRDSFGFSTAGDDQTMAVASIDTVDVFDLLGPEPRWMQTITINDFPAWTAVTALPVVRCLRGDRMFFGDQWADVAGVLSTGAVYVFRNEGSRWTFENRLTAASAHAVYRFGASIDFDGRSLVVGAPGASAGRGAVHVFESTDGGWKELQVLEGLKPKADHGSGVSVDGDWLLIGASHQYDSSVLDAFVHFYRRDFLQPSVPWTFSKTFADKADVFPYFGYSLDLDGEFAVAGDPGNPSAGAVPSRPVVAYRLEAGWNWVESQLLPQPDFDDTGPDSGGYGSRLDIRGADLVIGSPQFVDWGGTPGAAYHFRLEGNHWNYAGKVLPAYQERLDRLGGSILVLEDRVLLGAPGRGATCGPGWLGFLMCAAPGTVFDFQLSGDGSQYCHCGAAGNCNNPDGHGGCENSTEDGAILASAGTGSLAADDLRLQAFAMPPHQVAVLSIGTQKVSTPFGDGRLCIGGSVLHFPALTTGERGRVDIGPGVAGASNALGAGIQPGEPRHFQIYYRDPGGPCGSGVNLTNAVRVIFKP